MLTRSTRSGAAAYARYRLTGHSLHHTRSHGHSRIAHGRSLLPSHMVAASFTYGCRLYAQGLANVAPPLVLDTAAAAEQRPQQVGTRTLLRAAPRHPCLPGVPPRGWCRLATVATPACWAGAVLGASQLGSPASLGRHGWLCMALGDAPHSRGAALPCRAEAGAHTQTPRRKVCGS